MQPKHGDQAGRVRAAIAYSGKTHSQIGALLDPPADVHMVRRMTRGEWSKVKLHREYLRQLPKVLALPSWFPRDLNVNGEAEPDELEQLRQAVAELQRWRSDQEGH
jgi:hypothetical protein